MGDPISTATLLKVAIGATAVSTGLGVAQARQAKKAEKSRRAIEQRQEQRAQLAQVRQQQIQQARMQVAGAGTGTLDSSGFRGGISSVGSTVAGNISFAQQLSGMQSAVYKSMDKSAQLGIYKGIAQGVSSLASQAYTAGMGSASTGSVDTKAVNEASMNDLWVNRSGGMYS